jgi:hypothetical protein
MVTGSVYSPRARRDAKFIDFTTERCAPLGTTRIVVCLVPATPA